MSATIVPAVFWPVHPSENFESMPPLGSYKARLRASQPDSHGGRQLAGAENSGTVGVKREQATRRLDGPVRLVHFVLVFSEEAVLRRGGERRGDAGWTPGDQS